MSRNQSMKVITCALITWGICLSAQAQLYRWKTNDYAVVLDSNTVLNGKLMGMEGSNITDGGTGFPVTVWEWDPFYKVFWAGNDELTTINLARQGPAGTELYRNTGGGELWAASGGSETHGEVFFSDGTNESQFLYTTDTKASVTITDMKVTGEVTGKKGVFEASVGGEVGQKTVRVSRTLEAADPAVSIRLVFPSLQMLENHFGGGVEPADDFPYNYDTVLGAPAQDVSLTPPSGWNVYFGANGTQTITDIIVDEITSDVDLDLNYSTTEAIGASIPFVMLARIDDGATVEYYNFDPLGLEVIPEPATLMLLGLVSLLVVRKRRLL